MAAPTSNPLLTFLQSDFLSDFLSLNYEPTILILALLIIPILSYPFLPPTNNLPEVTVIKVAKLSSFIQQANLLLYVLEDSSFGPWRGFRPIGLPLWTFILAELTSAVFEAFTTFKSQDEDAEKTKKAKEEYTEEVYHKIWCGFFLIVMWDLCFGKELVTEPTDVKELFRMLMEGMFRMLMGTVFYLRWGPLSSPRQRVWDLRVLREVLERIVECLAMFRGVGFNSQGGERGREVLVLDADDTGSQEDVEARQGEMSNNKSQSSSSPSVLEGPSFSLDSPPWYSILACFVVATSTVLIVYRLIKMMKQVKGCA